MRGNGRAEVLDFRHGREEYTATTLKKEKKKSIGVL